MHDERLHEPIASAIESAAPAQTSAEQVDAVVARGHREARRTRRFLGVRRAPGLRVPAWTAVSAVALVVVAAVAFGALGARENGEAAIAKEEAFAALHPAPGMVVRTKTRTWAQNDGEAEPVIDGSSYDVYWIDFEGKRDRYESHLSSTDETVAVAVGDGVRYRYLGDDLDTEEPDLVINEAYGGGEVGSGALWPYYYLRTMLPSGKAVGEVEHEGEMYWEIRWDDARDTAGNRLDARALIDKVDYHPALIERHYPGGAHEIWEVLEWEVLAETDLPDGWLDVASLERPGVPRQSSWRAADLADKTDISVYWSGLRVGKAAISAELTEDESGPHEIPLFVIRRDYQAAASTAILGDHVVAWYSGDGPLADMTISSGPADRSTKLAQRLTALAKAGTVAESMDSAVGPAMVVQLPTGDLLAGIATDDATIVVQANNAELLEQTLKSLKRLKSK